LGNLNTPRKPKSNMKIQVHPEVLANWQGRKVKTRQPAPVVGDLKVAVGGIGLKVDAGAEPADCLPIPGAYRFPTKGPASKSNMRVLMALAKGRNCFIHGPPGTGKDAIVHAFSAWTRKPCLMVTFRPGTDLAPWFYMRTYENGQSGWRYGALWYALTQGLTGRDGVARPPMILLSDVDRADSAQAEWFRILTDSISGRILGPDGKMHQLFPGTQFVCTANSCGTGDSRGRMISANPIDASIMDRLGRAVEFTYLAWEDESVVLREKFPVLAEKTPEIFEQLRGACDAIRSAINQEDIYGEFTHRGICEVLLEAQDRFEFTGDKTKLLNHGFKAWLDRLDADNRLAATRLIDPFLKGGGIEDWPS
jgi:hypothetical protein